MADTLYELLELSRNASPDAIHASYQRLHAQHTSLVAQGDDNATNHLVALREAYYTLSDPERRKRYDLRLAVRETGGDVAHGQHTSFWRPILIILAIALLGLGYEKYDNGRELARLATEKAAHEARQLELAKQQAQEARIAAEQAVAQQRTADMIERTNRDRDIAYANQVTRDLQRAEAQSRLEQQRAEQARIRDEQQRQREAAIQLAREKAYLRHLEIENRRRY